MNLNFLEEGELDEIFGNECPLRKNNSSNPSKGVKEISLEEWESIDIKEQPSSSSYQQDCKIDEDLKKWLSTRRYLKREGMKLVFETKETEAYFEGGEGNEKVQEKLKKLDLMERKYDIPELAVELRRYNLSKAIVYLIERGNQDCIKKFNLPTMSNTCKEFYDVLKNGNLKIVKWFAENGLLNDNRFNFKMVDSVIKSEDLDAIRYLLNKGFCYFNVGKIDRDNCVTSAACSGNLHILKWFIENGDRFNSPLNAWVFYYAAQSGNLEMVKYLVSKECKRDIDAIIVAVRNDDMKMLEYLLEISNTEHRVHNTKPIRHAIKANNPKMVKYLMKANYAIPDEIYEWAVMNKNMDVIDLLSSSDEASCSIPTKIYEWAVINKNMDIITILSTIKSEQ